MKHSSSGNGSIVYQRLGLAGHCPWERVCQFANLGQVECRGIQGAGQPQGNSSGLEIEKVQESLLWACHGCACMVVEAQEEAGSQMVVADGSQSSQDFPWPGQGHAGDHLWGLSNGVMEEEGVFQ